MSKQRVRILVKGIVQGVGFRPFVYRSAHHHQLAGTVRNRGDAGVEIELEGDAEAVRAFTNGLMAEAPPLSRIDEISTEELPVQGTVGFTILPSTEEGSGSGLLPPDIAICDACVRELLGKSRFHGYWATSCTDCGPRFTVIDGLPYDRPRTSMRDFPMCPACTAEYTNPLDRRYHAQTTACNACGPTLLLDGETTAALARAVAALRHGKILAIKGIGGTHIACDASNARVVHELRRRLGRTEQPFALMETEARIEQIADPTAQEWALLRSIQRPIVLLRKKERALPEEVAPGLHTVGVMLPYSGLHVLLLSELSFPLVMTSANMPGRPMLIENQEIEMRLQGVVDHLLLHDRTIVARCDDSVQRVVSGESLSIRRSRGHVPQAIELDLGDQPMLALGPESDLTFAIYAEGRATPSQHIGNVDDLETLAYLTEAIDHLYAITRAQPPTSIISDAHPAFMTSHLADQLAQQYGAKVIRVQHHEAHFASVLAEHELDQAVGIVLDGYGYGSDGSAWGGEFFYAANHAMQRIGALRQVSMPGGDLAAAHPLRMAAAYLLAGGWDPECVAQRLAERGMLESEIAVLLRQINRKVNSPLSSSCGRFLDAVAAWIGVCDDRTYEGEPAMKLESAALAGSTAQSLAGDAYVHSKDGWYELDVAALFCKLVEFESDICAQDMAAIAQSALANGVAALAIRAAEQHDTTAVAFSGGVAYNEAITEILRRRFAAADLKLYRNRAVPCGDGGVSFGQLAHAGRFQDR